MKQKILGLMFFSSVIVLIGSCAKVNFQSMPIDGASSVTAPVSNIVSLSEVVAMANKKVDFLIVFDDSDSMRPDLQKLADGLSSFLKSLESTGVDWQACMTTTRDVPVNGVNTWGKSYDWVGYTPSSGVPAYILQKGTANLSSIFTATVNALQIGGPNSWDERAIKATYNHFSLGNPANPGSSGCYRAGSAVSVIIVSNEDERSVGGNKAMLKPNDYALSYQPLESEDLPQNLVDYAKSTFGSQVRFTFNSIIVKPGDRACEIQEDQGNSPCHLGYVYTQISQMTDGGIGSICDSDFTPSLNSFKDKIFNSLEQLNLQCAPDPATLQLKINGQSFQDFKLDNDVLKFNSPQVEGTKIDLQYICK